MILANNITSSFKITKTINKKNKQEKKLKIAN